LGKRLAIDAENARQAGRRRAFRRRVGRSPPYADRRGGIVSAVLEERRFERCGKNAISNERKKSDSFLSFHRREKSDGFLSFRPQGEI
jgi:hypothetical protein